MSGLASRRYAFAQAVQWLTRRPLTTLLALTLASLALAVPLLLATLAYPLQAPWRELNAPAQAVVFVAAGASGAEVAALRRKLAEHVGVADAVHVPRDAALAELMRRAPGGALPEIKTNPLPDAVQVTFADGLSPDAADALVAALRKLPRVDAVQFDGRWHRQWTALVGTATAMGAGVAVALLLLAVAAVAAAAQLPQMVERTELTLLNLIGANPGFVRRPFAYAGALIGLFGGLLASAAVAGSLSVLRPMLPGLGAAWGTEVRLVLLPWPVMAAVIGLAGLVGYSAGSAVAPRVSGRGPV
jgi:cell division transport system permease protein